MRKVHLIAFTLSLLVSGCATNSSRALTDFDKGNYPAAARGLRPLADAGNPVAQIDLGYLYQYGLGVPQSDGEALEMYGRAQRWGYVRADACMGVLYAQGSTITKDYGEAIRLFESGIQKGGIHARENRASLYYLGLGVQRDESPWNALDTDSVWQKDTEYQGYLATIRQRVLSKVKVPESLSGAHARADVLVRFSYLDGVVRNAVVMMGSGYADLDTAVIAALNDSSFPPPPPCMLIPPYYQVSISFGG